jgi:hypothetical protein
MPELTHRESPGDRLEAWREGMNPVLARLEGFELPADFPFDYSSASLARLEETALDRFPGGDPPAPAGGFLEGATAYVGESLLRAGGGRWDWDADDDLPVVRADDALALPPVSPLRLIIAAVRHRTGTELTDAHATLVAAVDGYAARHPGWAPTKEPTPGVDDIDEPAASPWLEQWLDERARAFAAWVADTGVAPAVWDFSPASLDALEALVKRRLLSANAVTEAADGGFVQGAVWYYGEVARRNKTAARWVYTPAVPGSSDLRESAEYNPFVGRPYIDQSGPDGNTLVPIFGIRFVPDEDRPGLLRKTFNRLA